MPYLLNSYLYSYYIEQTSKLLQLFLTLEVFLEVDTPLGCILSMFVLGHIFLHISNMLAL